MIMLLKIYYLFSIVPLVYHIRRVLNSNISNISNTSFLKYLDNEYTLLLVSVFAILSWAVVSLYPKKLLSRLFFCFGFYFICFTEYSFGKIDHYTHVWLYLNFLFLFIDKKFKNIEKIFEASRYLILSVYAIAGTWKLISLVNVLRVKSLTEACLDILGSSIAAGIMPISGIGKILIQYDFLLVIGFLLILVFQLANYSILFTKKHIDYLGFGAIIFHLLTGITLGIYYLPVIVCILIIFPFQSLIRDFHENNLSS